MKKTLVLLFLGSLTLFSCVERGKPSKDEESKATTEVDKKKVDHYTCPKGHEGSDKQGKCVTCSSVLIHNQAFHGTGGLALPKPTLQDPFNTAPSANTAPSPARNAFGDYHYICPSGHAGGSGTADNCKTCEAKLIHNQLYHK